MTDQENRSQPSVGMARQLQIYLGGLEGRRPALPSHYHELVVRAREAMTPEAYAYVVGSAGMERTASANIEAFADRELVPRMMRDVSSATCRTRILGTPVPAPIMLAPIGVQGIIHADGELASARAAAAAGIPFVLSTVSSKSIEEVAGEMGDAVRWFQLYWGRDREVVASFLSRAEAAGYSALIVTLDTKLLAWRPRDIDGAYLPFLRGDGLSNFMTDNVFRSSLSVLPEENPKPAIMRFAEVFSDPTVTWEDLNWLRSQTSLPIMVKGVLHPDDARAAVDHGVDGLIVSNHGGRQVDGAVAALDCLPGVVDAVGGRTEILFDSGVRSGADVVKAVALGAACVLVGRPYALALGLAGEVGVRTLIENLIAEIDLTVALTGHRNVSELGPHLFIDQYS